MISGLTRQLYATGADLADNDVPPPDEAARGQLLLRMMAGDAMRGAVAPLRGPARLPELPPRRGIPPRAGQARAEFTAARPDSQPETRTHQRLAAGPAGPGSTARRPGLPARLPTWGPGRQAKRPRQAGESGILPASVPDSPAVATQRTHPPWPGAGDGTEGAMALCIADRAFDKYSGLRRPRHRALRPLLRAGLVPRRCRCASWYASVRWYAGLRKGGGRSGFRGRSGT